MTNSPSDAALIWSLGRGAPITAFKDLIMVDTGERAFTAGLTYFVSTMHPIANPPHVVVSDDQQQPHKLEAADLREYFFTPITE